MKRNKRNRHFQSFLIFFFLVILSPFQHKDEISWALDVAIFLNQVWKGYILWHHWCKCLHGRHLYLARWIILTVCMILTLPHPFWYRIIFTYIDRKWENLISERHTHGSTQGPMQEALEMGGTCSIQCYTVLWRYQNKRKLLYFLPFSSSNLYCYQIR